MMQDGRTVPGRLLMQAKHALQVAWPCRPDVV